MHRYFTTRAIVGVVCAIGLTATVAWAQTVTPPAPAKGKLERLRVSAAPVSWDTNFTWLNPRSGNLDKMTTRSSSTPKLPRQTSLTIFLPTRTW